MVPSTIIEKETYKAVITPHFEAYSDAYALLHAMYVDAYTNPYDTCNWALC